MINKIKNLFVSFSGGLTSAFMLYYILNNEKYKGCNILVVFANTGKEREETLNFVNECSKRWNIKIHWIEYNPLKKHGFKNWFKVVDFKTASRNGEPFEKFIIKEGIPNVDNKGCSSRLKELPMHNFAKTYFKNEKYYTAIGIRFDESHRIKWHNAKKKRFIYPLAKDFPTTKEFVHKFWQTQHFTLNIKSYEGNCDCCWKKSDRKLYTLAKENPNSFKWWDFMEKQYGDGDVFFRKYRGAEDILNESTHFPKSKYAKCDTLTSKLKESQLSIFDLDNEKHCSCN